MTCDDLIAMASRAYPDDFVELADQEGDGAGDTLALFVAREIRDTYDEGATGREQILTAVDALNRGATELQSVVEALTRALEDDDVGACRRGN